MPKDKVWGIKKPHKILKKADKAKTKKYLKDKGVKDHLIDDIVGGLFDEVDIYKLKQTLKGFERIGVAAGVTLVPAEAPEVPVEVLAVEVPKSKFALFVEDVKGAAGLFTEDVKGLITRV